MQNSFTTYPHIAGAKERTTSLEAAEGIETSGRAETLRLACLERFQHGFKGTADDLAFAMGEPINSIRPRCTELLKRGLIEATGIRKKASGGRSSHVWKLA
jgi:predicted ArsR family transcriptional regulator